VVAGRADLRSTEANVFAQVVAAYLDVLRTEAIVRLNKVQVQTLETNLKATSDRFQIGDVTRTDVAQSQSRLALAVGNLRSAEAGLVQARETYIQLVGKAPEALKAPPPLPTLPAAPDEAVQWRCKATPIWPARANAARRPGSTLPPRAPRVCPRSACLPMWLSELSQFADGGGPAARRLAAILQHGRRGYPRHYPAVSGRAAQRADPPGPGPRRPGDGQ
jgi:hypothetical protein